MLWVLCFPENSVLYLERSATDAKGKVIPLHQLSGVPPTPFCQYWMPPDMRQVKMFATFLLLQLGWWRKNLSLSPYGRKRPCFTTQQPFCEGVRSSFLPEGSLALNKGGNVFFSKIPAFLFKMHYGFREQNDRLDKCELFPGQK